MVGGEFPHPLFFSALNVLEGVHPAKPKLRRSENGFKVQFVKTSNARSVLPLVVVAIFVGQCCATQSPQPPTSPANNGATGTPCLFDFERGEVPDCIRESPTGGLSIEPRYLKEVRFDSHGLAAVHSAKEDWMYVNRRGIVVVKGVPVMDTEADSFHDGLVRFVKDGKYGFANRKGKIVVPPIYDGAMNFEKGLADVCNGCVSKCAGDCEYHFFAGGNWFRIDTKGNVRSRIPSPH